MLVDWLWLQIILGLMALFIVLFGIFIAFGDNLFSFALTSMAIASIPISCIFAIRAQVQSDRGFADKIHSAPYDGIVWLSYNQDEATVFVDGLECDVDILRMSFPALNDSIILLSPKEYHCYDAIAAVNERSTDWMNSQITNQTSDAKEVK